VVAEPRYVDAGDLAGLEHGEALGDPHGVPVHEHLERVLRVAGKLHARAAHRVPRPRQLRVHGRHSRAGLRRAGGGGRGDPAAGGGRCQAARRQYGLGAAQRPRDESHGGGEAIGSRGGGRGRALCLAGVVREGEADAAEALGGAAATCTRVFQRFIRMAVGSDVWDRSAERM
jgi:hypothetical protein